MIVDTVKGCAYVLTCTAACTVHAVLDGASPLLVLNASKEGQYGFVAPTDAVEVSDEHALVTQTFKGAVPGLSARDGIQPGDDATLKSLLAESGTFTGTVNANGGVNIPLAVGAATDTGAVNRFYTSGLAGAVSALVQPIYLNSSSITVAGSISKSSNGTLAGLTQRFSVGAASAGSNAYGSAVIPLMSTRQPSLNLLLA